MSGSHPHAGEYPPEPERVAIHGVSEGKKFSDDFRPSCEPEEQIWKPSLLVSGVLREYGGANKKAIEEYIRHQLDEDEAYEQMTFKEYIDPFTGGKNK